MSCGCVPVSSEADGSTETQTVSEQSAVSRWLCMTCEVCRLTRVVCYSCAFCKIFVCFELLTWHSPMLQYTHSLETRAVGAPGGWLAVVRDPATLDSGHTSHDRYALHRRGSRVGAIHGQVRTSCDHVRTSSFITRTSHHDRSHFVGPCLPRLLGHQCGACVRGSRRGSSRRHCVCETRADPLRWSALARGIVFCLPGGKKKDSCPALIGFQPGGPPPPTPPLVPLPAECGAPEAAPTPMPPTPRPPAISGARPSSPAIISKFSEVSLSGTLLPVRRGSCTTLCDARRSQCR